MNSPKIADQFVLNVGIVFPVVKIYSMFVQLVLIDRPANISAIPPAVIIANHFCLSFISKFNTFLSIGCCDTSTTRVSYANG